jgi:hypothetical protein
MRWRTYERLLESLRASCAGLVSRPATLETFGNRFRLGLPQRRDGGQHLEGQPDSVLLPPQDYSVQTRLEEGEKLFTASAAPILVVKSVVSGVQQTGDGGAPALDRRRQLFSYARPNQRGLSMLFTVDQHRRLAEVYEEAAADQSHSERSLPKEQRVSDACPLGRGEGEGPPIELRWGPADGLSDANCPQDSENR